MQIRSEKIYYGWFIVMTAFIANFMSVGISFYIMNAFMEPLSKLNGWTRTDINMALIIGMMAGAISQYVWGTVIMKTGPRILMFLGPIISGLACIAMGYAKNLLIFYLVFIVLNVGARAYTGVVTGTAVSNWFVRKRGNAMGFASAGISFSGAVLPFVAMILILRIDPAGAFLWLGVATMVVGPLSWLVVRNWPEELGLAPDGAIAENVQSPATSVKREENNSGPTGPEIEQRYLFWNPRRLFSTVTFWKVGFSFAFSLIGIVGVMSQLKPRFSDIGFNDMAAMAMMAVTALIGAAGKYVCGTLCDRFDARKVVAVLMSLNVLGLLLALFPAYPIALVLFIIIFGFSMGGIVSTFPIIVADLFGRESFPAVFRFFSIFLLIELFGFFIAGQCFDRTGSYNLAYAIFAFLGVIAVSLMLTVKRPV